MAVSLNLLPQDLAVGSDVNKVIKTLRAMSVIGLAIFIIFAAGVGGFFLISTFQLQSITTQNNQLSAQVKAQQSVEQQLVLLKDRVAKIKLALGAPSAKKQIDLITPLLAVLPSNAVISELNLDTSKVSASIIFKSSADVAALFQKIYATKNFGSVSLSSFGFNPTSGYLVLLSLTAK